MGNLRVMFLSVTKFDKRRFSRNRRRDLESRKPHACFASRIPSIHSMVCAQIVLTIGAHWCLLVGESP